jgi:hypothetical protein
MAAIFTREELYELVWSKPITHFAKQFGLSDVAIHKICKKHDIPTPPLGWWAKHAAGKPVKRTALPQKDGDAPTKIVIADAQFTSEAVHLRAARETARVAADSMPSREAPMDPVVRQTLAALRKLKPSDRGILSLSEPGLVKCEVAATSIERVGHALNRLAQAAGAHGFALIGGKSGAIFEGAPESVGISVAEPYRRMKHVLTPKEEASLAAWEKKRDRAVKFDSWGDIAFSRPTFPEWDYHPTGQLALELERVYVREGQSPRSAFRDGKTQRVEEMAADIAVGIVVVSAATHAERLRREVEENRAEQARRRREDAARAKYIQERREGALAEVLNDVEKLERARRILGLLNDQLTPSEPRTAAFLEWASMHIAGLEMATSSTGLQARFEAEHLFGQDDDHGFAPPPGKGSWHDWR